MRLGHLARLRGQVEQAVAAYKRSLQVSADMESLAGTPDALEGLAATVLGYGETEKAFQLSALAHAMRTRTGAVRARYNDAWVASLFGALQAQRDTLQWQAVNAEFAALTTGQLRIKAAELALSPQQT